MVENYGVEVNRCQNLFENVAEWKEDFIKIKNNFRPSTTITKDIIDMEALYLRDRCGVDCSPDCRNVFKWKDRNGGIIHGGFYDTDYKVDSIDLRSPSVRYSTSGMVNQNFGVPISYIRYVIKRSRDYVLQKLFVSCKYFFYFKPTPICYKLDVAENYSGEQYFENTLFISTEAFMTATDLPDFHYTRVLSLQGVTDTTISAIIQSIKSKLPLITELHLFRQQIRFNEFKLLTSQVEIFSMHDRSVIYDGIDKMTVPNIVDEMPKLKDAIFNHEYRLFAEIYEYSEPTKFLNTCVMLSVCEEGDYLDVISFCDFIKKNCTSTTFIKLDLHKGSTYFSPEFDDEKCKELAAALSEVDWEARHQQPHMKLTLNRKDYYFS